MASDVHLCAYCINCCDTGGTGSYCNPDSGMSHAAVDHAYIYHDNDDCTKHSLQHFQQALLMLCRVQGAVSGALPADYASWTGLRAFELADTRLSGTIPPTYFSSWLQLENFTIDGASLTGALPPPWQCTSLKHYVVQNTPVASNMTHPAWVLEARAANMTQITGIGLGEYRMHQVNSHIVDVGSWCSSQGRSASRSCAHAPAAGTCNRLKPCDVCTECRWHPAAAAAVGRLQGHPAGPQLELPH